MNDGNAKLNVLIVEDDHDIRESLASCLEKGLDGVTIHRASSGEDALDQLGRTPVGLVFANHRLGGVDGLEVLAKYRAVFPRVTRIMITGHPHDEALQMAVREGLVHDVMTKPIDPLKFLERTSQIAARRRPNRGTFRERDQAAVTNGRAGSSSRPSQGFAPS